MLDKICASTSASTALGRWPSDEPHVSTSYAERMNLNILMGLRRFTQLTNEFSKKIENHFYALSVYFTHVTPAMAAGVTLDREPAVL